MYILLFELQGLTELSSDNKTGEELQTFWRLIRNHNITVLKMSL